MGLLTLGDQVFTREANLADVPSIRALRMMHERPFVGYVEQPHNLTWFVAMKRGHVVACVGLCVAAQRKIIVTDLYHDGSFAGRRGLATLIKDLVDSRAKLFVSVPFDRPRLKAALERRGVVFKAWHGEYPA